WRKGDGFDTAFLREFLHLAVRSACPGGAARCKTDRSAGACCHGSHPFARDICKFAHRSIGVRAADATIFTAGDKRLPIDGNSSTQQPVMGCRGLVAVIELMD